MYSVPYIVFPIMLLLYMFSMWLSGLVYVFRSVYISNWLFFDLFGCGFLMLLTLWNEPYIFIIYQIQYVQRLQCRFQTKQNEQQAPRIKISNLFVVWVCVCPVLPVFVCSFVIRISCHPSNLNIVEEFSGWRWRWGMSSNRYIEIGTTTHVCKQHIRHTHTHTFTCTRFNDADYAFCTAARPCKTHVCVRIHWCQRICIQTYMHRFPSHTYDGVPEHTWWTRVRCVSGILLVLGECWEICFRNLIVVFRTCVSWVSQFIYVVYVVICMYI